MIIETAQPVDAAAIAELVNRAYRGENAAAGWTHEADLLDGQRTDPKTLADAMAAGAVVLIARRGPDLLGCVSVEPKAGEAAAWYVGMLTVSPDRQASGLGSRLLSAAENHARAAGARRLEMTVISLRTSLIAFYERRGYAATGKVTPFPYGDERFGRPRRPDLAFVVLGKPIGPTP